MWAKSFLIYFLNFRMDQTLESIDKYLSTPYLLATRLTLSKKSTSKDQILVMKRLKRKWRKTTLPATKFAPSKRTGIKTGIQVNQKKEKSKDFSRKWTPTAADRR